MTQLLLGIAPTPVPTLDNFAVGRNAAAVEALRAFGTRHMTDRCIYLWGEAGSGCSHLLLAWAGLHHDGLHHLADDVEGLDDGAQIALFNRFNRARAGDGWLLVAGRRPPARLALRDDLRSRLAWGLVFEIHPPTDDDKRAALKAQAAARGMAFTDEMLGYLMSRARRDMRSLTQLVEAVDRHSLQTKRPVTLPLLRELLSQNQTLPL